jgi:hypothetical protein
MTTTTQRVTETAAAVDALAVVEALLENCSAEKAEQSLKHMLAEREDANPISELLRKVAIEVMARPVRMTSTEVLENVAQALKVDFNADL